MKANAVREGERHVATPPAVCSILLLCALALLASCAAKPRPESAVDDPRQERRAYLQQIEKEHRQISLTVLRHAETIQARNLAQGLPGKPILNVLVISGGGDFGAFGAGFLKGWGNIEDGPYARPKFDIVTGVSTGALIAPFAFIGEDEAYDRIYELYIRPNPKWFNLRSLLFFLPGYESFMDSRGLRSDLERTLDKTMIARIAEGSAKDRLLAIGTTNLDQGLPRIWNLGEVAEQVRGKEPKRFYDILMASAAIPGVFPPVDIDRQLYADGGVTQNIFLGSDRKWVESPKQLWKKNHPGMEMPGVRIWVVINNKLLPDPEFVKLSWTSIVGRSVSATIIANTLLHLNLLEEFASDPDLDVEFRFVAIPESFKPPSKEDFSEETMSQLGALGVKMGSDPTVWRSTAPSLSWPQDLQDLVGNGTRSTPDAP